MAELYDQLAADVALTDQDRAEMLPSGGQLRYRNRIAWARTYLKKAGLIEAPAEGRIRITERGRNALKQKPDQLNTRYLKQFPEFVEFHTYRPKPDEASTSDNQNRLLTDSEDEETPEESLERIVAGLQAEVANELLERTKKAPPEFFERLVVDLLLRMGYGGSQEAAGRAIGRSGDGGIDGVINEDVLGLDVVYVQAKRWEATVGRPVVQAFIGSLEGVRAQKGVMITTSAFSAEARAYVQSIGKRVILIEGRELAQHMLKYGLGVTRKAQYDLKRIDSDYFEA